MCQALVGSFHAFAHAVPIVSNVLRKSAPRKTPHFAKSQSL